MMIIIELKILKCPQFCKNSDSLVENKLHSYIRTPQQFSNTNLFAKIKIIH